MKNSTTTALKTVKVLKVDRENIKKFCDYAKFPMNKFSVAKLGDDNSWKTDNLKADEMKDIFKKICDQGDFSSFDAFICFISSHGNSVGVVGVDGEATEIKSMTKYLNERDSLTGKPKLFFTQNCRGDRKDGGVQHKTKKGMVTVPDKSHEFYVTIPKEADILTAYSSVDGYESYRNKKEGSWFITELTKVLTEHANDMQLTDMLVIVSEKVANLEHEDEEKLSKQERHIWKQMPCYTSTLRSSVVFEIPSGQNI